MTKLTMIKKTIKQSQILYLKNSGDTFEKHSNSVKITESAEMSLKRGVEVTSRIIAVMTIITRKVRSYKFYKFSYLGAVF